jgi:hypothetical protein
MMRCFGIVCLLVCVPALANDLDALSLADQAPTTVERTSYWQAFAEVALGESTRRSGGGAKDVQRLSLDIRLDKPLAPGWRIQFADRLDMNWQNKQSDQDQVNTLKEAYVSWQAAEGRIVDAGRINVRNGVALGYNPTDFFRGSAVRSVVSVDPASLKKNRLGSVMARGQMFWEQGSLTALYSPKIKKDPSDGAFNPDFGSTNNQDRWLFAVSQRLSENISPQWLVYHEQGAPPQFGLNLAVLANNATIVFVEWAGGRSGSQLSQAFGDQDDKKFHNRSSIGMTYTAPNKLSLTLEYETNNAALDRETWDRLGRTNLPAYGRYRQWAQDAQELPTRQAILAYAAWQDIMVNNFDLNFMQRFSVADRSRLIWIEGRYHFDRMDLALQWQVNRGHALSEFGATPQRRAWQVLMRYFF